VSSTPVNPRLVSKERVKMALNTSSKNAGRNRRAVGVFPTRESAEDALHALKNSGFGMEKVSVVAQDADRRDGIAGADVKKKVGNKNVGNKADEGAEVGALSGGTVGGLTGLLVGLGLLAIPGIGPVMLAGEVATTLATALAGGAIGAAAGGLLGGLVGLGIPEKRAKAYSDSVAKGNYLVIVDGTEDELQRAEAILKRGGIQDWGVYDIPATKAASAGVVDRSGTGVVSAQANTANTAVEQSSTTLESSAPAPIRPTDEEAVRLYEERLVVDKDREKTGEVVVGKRVETETAKATIPIEQERVVIERVATEDLGAATTVGADAFQDTTIRVDVYEETPEFRKEAFVREEVKIHKEVDREVVKTEETLRREELDIDTTGQPVVDTSRNRQSGDRV
jgi:uncharacterized protein (TIGR02271 family)